MNTLKSSSTLLSLTIIAACGGAGSETVVERPTFFEVADADGNSGTDAFEVVVDAEGNSVTVSYDGTTEQISTETVPDLGTYVAAFNDPEPGSERKISLVSATSNSIATLSSRRRANSNLFSRIGTTTIPLSGSATLQGDYIGQELWDDGTPLVGANVIGDVTLNVDFEEQLISGEITNRQGYSLISGTTTSHADYEDIALHETEITANGGFSGRLTGGSFSDGDDGPGGYYSETIGDFTYDGLLAGEGATEAVGGLSITHLLPNEGNLEITELGSFAAGH